MSHHINIIRIKGVYHALGSLTDVVAFVGGATVSLYADKPEYADVRPTNDIDVLIEIGTYVAYIDLQQKLADLKFEVDVTSKVVCRYKYEGLTVDIMPIDENVLGFSNRWYKEGFAHLERYKINEETTVNIFSLPYFIASKIEAFKGRGENDGRTSQDFEDIVFVLDNRKNAWQEMRGTEPALNEYLKKEWAQFLKNIHLEEWLSAHLEYDTAVKRAHLILAEIKNFIN